MLSTLMTMITPGPSNLANSFSMFSFASSKECSAAASVFSVLITIEPKIHARGARSKPPIRMLPIFKLIIKLTDELLLYFAANRQIFPIQSSASTSPFASSQ